MRAVPYYETLYHEFKSDLRKYPLVKLLDAVMCMANGEGGTIYLGVEDDGSISGLHPAHRNLQRIERLLNRYTYPHARVQLSPELADGLVIARIQVPKSVTPIKNPAGAYLRRQLQDINQEPQCVRFVPKRINTLVGADLE